LATFDSPGLEYSKNLFAKPGAESPYIGLGIFMDIKFPYFFHSSLISSNKS
jgi:hypothetical protein